MPRNGVITHHASCITRDSLLERFMQDTPQSPRANARAELVLRSFSTRWRPRDAPRPEHTVTCYTHFNITRVSSLSPLVVLHRFRFLRVPSPLLNQDRLFPSIGHSRITRLVSCLSYPSPRAGRSPIWLAPPSKLLSVGTDSGILSLV